MPLNHLKEEELEQYCLGRLAESRCARVEEHILLCASCRDRLTEADAFLAAMHQASRRCRAAQAADQAASAAAAHWWSGCRPGHLFPAFAIAVVVICAAVWSGRPPSIAAPQPFAVQLTAVRGGATGGRAPAGRPLVLELDLTGLSGGQGLAGEVVDVTGHLTARFAVKASTRLRPLPAGSYFVRIYRGSELLREYALTLTP